MRGCPFFSFSTCPSKGLCTVLLIDISSHSLGLYPIKYFWRNLKICVCPHPTWQSLRGEQVRWRMEDNNHFGSQMMKSNACCIIPKKIWGGNWCQRCFNKVLSKGCEYLFLHIYMWYFFIYFFKFAKISNKLLSHCHYGVLFVEFWAK